LDTCFSMLAVSFCYLLFFGNTNNTTERGESPAKFGK